MLPPTTPTSTLGHMRDTIALLWRWRNSCDMRLRTITRELLRQDVQALRRLSRNLP